MSIGESPGRMYSTDAYVRPNATTTARSRPFQEQGGNLIHAPYLVFAVNSCMDLVWQSGNINPCFTLSDGNFLSSTPHRTHSASRACRVRERKRIRAKVTGHKMLDCSREVLRPGASACCVA